MGCIASALGSCAGSCCGSCAGACACAGCKRCCDVKASTMTRLPYLVIMFLGVVLALVVRYWADGWVIHLYWFNLNVCTSDRCVGFSAAYRVSFTLFFFFLIHCCCLLTKNCMKFHSRYWFWKTLLLTLTLIVTFLIPNAFFDIYAAIARVVSGVFLLLQIIILIDFAYHWDKKWVDEKEWLWPTAIAAVIMYAGSYTLAAFEFEWFTGGSGDCGRNKFFIAWTIISTAIVTILPRFNYFRSERGRLLPAAVVTLYSFYLCYSSLRSDPGPCNTLQSDDTAQVVISIIIAGVTVCYAGWNLANAETLFGDEPEPEDAAAGVGAHEDDAEKGAAAGSGSPTNSDSGAAVVDKSADKDEYDNMDDETRERARSRNLRFHVVMAVASMYVAMLITNWGVETASSSQSYDLGDVSVWVKIVSQWVLVLLYFWTLVQHRLGPLLCPSRDWGDGSD